MLYESLPEEVQLLAKTARQVAREKLAPLVAGVEEARCFSPAVLHVLADAGFLGLVVPEEYGGVDGDVRAQMVVIEEVSRVFPSASTILTAHWFATKLIARWAAGPWVRPLLARAAGDQVLGAIAASEPEAGSDLAGVRTTARRDGGSWVIDGVKRFITNGGIADYYVVIARTGAAGAAGISLFFVEADREGVAATRLERKMGLHGSATAEMVFEDVRVPRDHLIGTEGEGFGHAMDGFDEGRIVVAALSVGIADSALEHALAYARARQQFGKPIASFQGLQFMLADMAIQAEAARSLTYDAGYAYTLGLPTARRLASMAKTLASDVAMAVASDAVQIHGGYGYIADFPVEMLMRDAKINQIYEGTNQVQRMLIARALLGPAAQD